MIKCNIRGLRAVWASDVVLDGLSLDVAGVNKMIPLMGPSGKGKSTLLYHMAALKHPTEGTISWDFGNGDTFSWDHAGMSNRTANELRREHFSFVFQDNTMSDHLKVEENLTYPLMLQGLDRATAREQARVTLKKVFDDEDQTGIERFLRSYPRQISGGQRQRVAVVQALLHKSGTPRVLFADEPTGNLDQDNRMRLMTALSDWVKESDTQRLVIWVTHHDGHNDPELGGVEHRIYVDAGCCRWQRADQRLGWVDSDVPAARGARC